MPPQRIKKTTRSRRKPFKQIALCLSGGGYRAAAFHLGTLAYLKKIGLLENVTLISTVSGGTLTGATYALSLKQKKSFEEFYDQFYSFMNRVNLVKLSFASVGRKTNNALGYQDLITSIADVYDRKLFLGERFGIFWNRTPIHLKEIIFNSTEFRTGIAFRFQKCRSAAAKIGNNKVNLTIEDAQKIRLADIAAASSCFPGGFEPLAFPHDFIWPDDKISPTLTEQFDKPLPLMDGGVYDNQGIQSAVLRVKREYRGTDLFIISDTDSLKDNIYSFPEKHKTGWLSLKSVRIIAWLLVVLSILGCGTLLKNFYDSIIDSEGWVGAIIYSGLPALILACVAGIVIWAYLKIKQIIKRVPHYGEKSWNDIKRLTLNQFIDLLEIRIRSLYALASSVFMKRVRDLVYGYVYRDEHFKNKRVSNLISKLFDKKRKYPFNWLKPSDRIQKISQDATGMATTLWFDNEKQLKNLVDCGRISICHTLLEYIIRRYGEKESKYPVGIRGLFAELKKDWVTFNREE